MSPVKLSILGIPIVLLIFLSIFGLASAHGDGHETHSVNSFEALEPQESSEPLLVRVINVNATTLDYTFKCTIPSTANPYRYWTVRPDTNDLEAEFYTFNDSITYRLNKNVMYHVGCQVNNGSSQTIRGDFHIDRRIGPNTDIPDVVALETNSTHLVARCYVPNGTVHYNLYWTALSIWGTTTFPAYNNNPILNVSVPNSGLWDIDCGVWDSDKNKWTQWGLPVEFFPKGPAYVPTATGCLPWQNCSNNSSTNQTNQTYSGPHAPNWIEPTENKTDVDLYSFKLHVLNYSDALNYSLISTDFEIRDAQTSELIWVAYNQTVNTNRIESGDGEFIGSLAGNDSLLLNRTYKTRARFKSNSYIPYSPWSEVRTFTTIASYPTGNASMPWTVKEGYSIELVADNINLPTVIIPAPNLYQNLPNGSRPKLYFTQLYGQVGVLLNNGSYVQYANHLLNFDSFGSIPGSGEIGLTGIYADNNTGDLFLSIVYDDPSAGFMSKVVKFDTDASGTTYTSTTTLISGLPAAPAHYAHTITRGPDGKLYLQIGDDDHSDRSKDLNYLSGKILRFNDDGSIPSDNPIVGSYIYASGFRNPFGGVWRPGTNELYVTNNGPDEDDGIFKVMRNSTFGWCCSTEENAWNVWHATVAPTQITIDAGKSNFPQDSNGTLYTALSGKTYGLGPSVTAKRISQFKILPDGTRESLGDLVRYTGTGRATTLGVTFASDGLYFTDLYGEAGFVGVGKTNGRIYKISPGNTTAINQTQVFSAGIGQAPWFPQGLNMVWECKGIGGSGSYKYDYSFGDGNGQYNSPQDNIYYTYPANGTYNASCTVKDQVTGLSTSAFTTIIFGNLSSGNQNNTNQTNNNQTNPSNTTTNTSVCYNSLSALPAKCIGGIITSDIFGGCRTIACSNDSNGRSLSLMACEKPGSYQPQFFEMYKQGGNGGVTICIGQTCMQNDGFVKSPNFPICLNAITNQTNNQTPSNQTNNNQTNPGNTTNNTIGLTYYVNLSIAPWYPKGRSYVFRCDATGFVPSKYDYYFGNGEKQVGRIDSDVYYTYSLAGEYSPLCIAYNNTLAKNSSISITVI